MNHQRAAAVLLASGGMDSTTLAYWLMRRNCGVTPLFIDYGQHCAKTEYEALKMVLPTGCARPIAVNISDIYHNAKSRLISEPNLWIESMEGDPLYLPYRNLLLLSVGAAFATSHNSSVLYAAFINSNHAKEIDCSARFFSTLEKVLSEYGSIELRMPFRNMSKVQVARMGVRLRVPLAATYSCQASSRVPCGACPNCVDRLEALKQIG
jgi:7-cyano-7-deazaguanine synthase